MDGDGWTQRIFYIAAKRSRGKRPGKDGAMISALVGFEM
jgi:hypothetical protein